MKRLVHGLGIAAALALSPAPGGAQTDGWGPIADTARLGQGQGACWTGAENSACLLLTCRDGGPFEIGLVAVGGSFGFDRRVPVHVRVDGGPVYLLPMVLIDVQDIQHAAVTYDPARHGALLRELRTGRIATVALYGPDQNPLPYLLGNRPQAVDAAMERCGVSPPGPAPAAAPAATPTSDPTRFVRVDPALRDPSATALARTLMSGILEGEPGTDVSASLALLPDGRRILVVEHGVSIDSYGITGVGTFVFTADPAGPFRMAYRTTGVTVWLDTASLSEGFPDLWVMSFRGVSQPFGVWRHLGGGYAHQRNVAP